MKPSTATLLLAAIASAFYLGPKIWKALKAIPAYQCPRCYSYAVHEDDEAENVLHCEECFNEWQDENE